MSDMPKRMVVGALAVAGIVALAAITDLVLGVPFSGSEHSRTMDIIFLICAGIVGYLGWDALRDLS